MGGTNCSYRSRVSNLVTGPKPLCFFRGWSLRLGGRECRRFGPPLPPYPPSEWNFTFLKRPLGDLDMASEKQSNDIMNNWNLNCKTKLEPSRHYPVYFIGRSSSDRGSLSGSTGRAPLTGGSCGRSAFYSRSRRYKDPTGKMGSS